MAASRQAGDSRPKRALSDPPAQAQGTGERTEGPRGVTLVAGLFACPDTGAAPWRRYPWGRRTTAGCRSSLHPSVAVSAGEPRGDQMTESVEDQGPREAAHSGGAAWKAEKESIAAR